jgi:hypothetical protein
VKNTKELAKNLQNDEVARGKCALNGCVSSTGMLMEAGVKRKNKRNYINSISNNNIGNININSGDVKCT